VKPRSIPLIGVAISIIVAVAFWFLLYQPRAEEQVALEEETAQLVTQQQQRRNEIRQLEEVQAHEEDIRAALARLGEYVPEGVDQPAVVRQFQDTAKAAKVAIVSLTFGGAEPMADAPPAGDPATTLGAIPVTMVVEGSYYQAVDFFRRLEVDVPRALLVETVAVSEGEDKFPQLLTTWSGRLFGVVPVPPETLEAEAAAAAAAEAQANDGAAPSEDAGGAEADEEGGPQ
jgi:Tfp pilus assembly protein PilO